MTSAVIIFLREVLEAMLIISILLASCHLLGARRRWVFAATLLGLLGAGIYAQQFDRITDLFDGLGQEVVNAISLVTIGLCLATYGILVSARISHPHKSLSLPLIAVTILVSVGLSITREVAELYIYLSGYWSNPDGLLPVILGGTLGAGIGLSVGALIYFAMASLNPQRNLLVSCVLMVPLTAGLASQACNYLIQADYLPSQLPLWNTSELISETSIIGELLYAIFSYEATPTLLQITIYLSSALAIVIGMVLMARTGKTKPEATAHYG